MTINDKINDLEILKAEIEWDYDLHYQILLTEVIKDLNRLRQYEYKEIIEKGEYINENN